MRKFFFLIPAMLLSLAMSAAEIEISSSTSNIISITLEAAAPGDVIVLTDNGPYVNKYATENGDDYVWLNKDITIKAADGVNPEIKLEVPFMIINAASAKFIGIKFNGVSIDSHYDWLFRFYSDEDNNLELEDCEITGVSKYIFYVSSGKKANLLSVKNCDIHDNTQRIVYNYKATLNKLLMDGTEISNSSHYIVHNNQSTLDSCILKNCNIHNNTNRGILNEATINSILIDGCQFSYFTAYPIVDNYDNASLGNLKINGTEFFSNSQYMINGTATSHADSCIITNCYVHNNTKNFVYFRASTVENVETCDGVVIANSTFENNDFSSISYSLIDINYAGTPATDDTQVLVDHCTFYNCPVKNSDYAAVKIVATHPLVSNSIFALPALDVKNGRAIHMQDGREVRNCLTYNYVKDSNWGIRDGITKTNCVTKQNPLFTDAANGDFTFPNNWVSMNVSPACAAATDGSDLGDPRWYTAATLPSADFATPYLLTGNKAILADSIWYNSEDGYLYGDGEHNKKYGSARWKFHAETACAVGVAANLNSGNTSGHKLRINVFDADGNNFEFSKNAHTLPGALVIPAEGDYVVVLNDDQEWSSVKIDNVTIAYMGGAVQDIPGTTNINEAWYTSKGTRADGKISFDSYSDQWVKWNMALTETGKKAYDFILNIDNPTEYGHRFYITIYEEGVEDPIATLSEHEWNSSFKADGPLALNLGSAMLESEKNYTVKVTNAESGAQPKIISITTTYSGGNVIDIPETLNVADAWFTGGATRANNQITYSSWNTADSWVKWNVVTNDYLYCDVKLNISTDNAHKFYVALYEDEANEPIVSLNESYTNESQAVSKEINLGRINLPANKKYVVKVTNPVGGSHAKIDNLQFTEVVTPTLSLPATLLPADAMLSAEAWIDNDSILFTARGSEGHNSVNWAKWKVSVEEKGLYNFTAYVSRPNGGQKYEIALLSIDESTEIFTPYADNDIATGDQTTSTGAKVLEAGDYILRVRNTYNYAESRLLKVEVERGAITIDEAETNAATVIGANLNITADIQLTRSYATGVYNTICLPFNVNNDALKAVFGNDVELLEMGSATLEGAVLNLNFDAATDLISGKPYLIRSSQNIVNPTFTAAMITETAAQTTAGTAANFIGTFVKQTIPASENNLYLGTDNKLYFSNNDVTIKGLRAYFHVNIPNPQQNIKAARIVTQGQVVTDVELVGAENQGILKTIENGQVIIIRDGIRYNVMGTKIQ